MENIKVFGKYFSDLQLGDIQKTSCKSKIVQKVDNLISINKDLNVLFTNEMHKNTYMDSHTIF